MMHTRALPLLVRKQFRLDDLLTTASESSGNDQLDPESLRRQANWIRDDLDPIVACHGPESLKSDQVVTVFKFLERLRRARVAIEHIRYSRLHLAVLCICSAATRWPTMVINEADKLLEKWSARYGDLGEIGTILYEEGGRLFGICGPNDISKEVLEVKWSRSAGSKTASGFARRHGDLGFKPGDWWINTMLAYHAGVIDSGVPAGRIVSDKHGAYALVLNAWDEVDSPDPNAFTYKAKPNETGRFRLTAATPASRQPVRVLRCHSLHSFWAPRAGIRYDGLYTVSGWAIRRDSSTKAWTYDITFARLSSELPMSEVLRHPLAEEVDDYTEFRRLRAIARDAQNPLHRARPLLEAPKSEPKLHNNINAPGNITVPPKGPTGNRSGLRIALPTPESRAEAGPAVDAVVVEATSTLPPKKPHPRLRMTLASPPQLQTITGPDVAELRLGGISTGVSPGAPRTPLRPVAVGTLTVLPVASPAWPESGRGSPGPGGQGKAGEGDYFSFGGA